MSDQSRLSQIEKLLETSAKMIVRHDQEMADLREAFLRHDQEMADLRESASRNDERLARLTDIFIESMAVIREMQAQVRGIQTENQRILKHLFGEND